MTRFSASLEVLSSKRAIVTLADQAGHWAGSYRVDSTSRTNLYEQGYRTASREATIKGGTLDRFSHV